MTDKEAFVLLHKHIGEKGIFQCKEMLRMSGFAKTMKTIEDIVLNDFGEHVHKQIKPWLHQAITFLNNKSENENSN